MTLSLNRTVHLGIFASALAYTSLTFAALVAPAPAQAKAADGPFYTAELAQPAAERTLVAGGVAWTCSGTKCVGTKGTSRPARVCRQLQRDVGEIVAFTSKGEQLEADKLAKCNG